MLVPHVYRPMTIKRTQNGARLTHISLFSALWSASRKPRSDPSEKLHCIQQVSVRSKRPDSQLWTTNAVHSVVDAKNSWTAQQVQIMKTDESRAAQCDLCSTHHHPLSITEPPTNDSCTCASHYQHSNRLSLYIHLPAERTLISSLAINVPQMITSTPTTDYWKVSTCL